MYFKVCSRRLHSPSPHYYYIGNFYYTSLSMVICILNVCTILRASRLVVEQIIHDIDLGLVVDEPISSKSLMHNELNHRKIAMFKVDILFGQIKTFIKVCVAFVC